MPSEPPLVIHDTIFTSSHNQSNEEDKKRIAELERLVAEQKGQLIDAGERAVELNGRIGRLETELMTKGDECDRLKRKAKRKKKRAVVAEAENAEVQRDLKEKMARAMHELERKIEEIEKLQQELQRKESHEKEFESAQRDVLAVRLKMDELKRTVQAQEETIQGYSELLKRIGFTTTQTGTAQFQVHF